MAQQTAIKKGTTSQPARRNLEATGPSRMSRILWQGKIFPAFWTVTSILSLVVNVILLALLLALGRQLFFLKSLVTDQLIGGLYSNFVKMDQATIETTVTVNDTIQVIDTIPVVFDLPLVQETDVILTRDTEIPNTWVSLNTAGTGINLSINSPADITLPEGTPLRIKLDMMVPVSQTVPVVLNVPVSLTVPVSIPLSQTQLHEPFVGLRNVVGPYQELLGDLPGDWYETPLCGPLTEWACDMWLNE
ncbi:MAG: hypothetical protein EHM70_02005 [Chloroflexota bacterium]|nr:MAG: hypothetical protein EHM70_02005 [Chloroflexota bacterium]